MDYEEAQGLTAEAVRNYLKSRGWARMPSYWKKSDGTIYDTSTDSDLLMDQGMRSLSHVEGKSVQDLLREINPRLHPWPSKEARAAHQEYWLAVCAQDGTACMGRFSRDVEWFKHSGNLILTEEDTFAGFWPCDAHGNKVRWPEKDGVML